MSDEIIPYPHTVHLLAEFQVKPGQKKLALALHYDDSPKPGTLSGEARIIPSGVPDPVIHTVHVRGFAHIIGANSETRVFTLEGPEIGTPESKFSAVFVTDLQWKGYGCFFYDNKWVHNVPIHRVPLD